ncbi:MAG: hypothetical protein WC488_03960 [Candidatus Micrarchaeia archaeon]
MANKASSPYMKAALLTLAIALLGFFFITQLDSMRAGELREAVDELRLQSDSERLLYLYSQVMDNNTAELCGYVSNTEESKASRAYALSEKIRYYEQSNIMNSDYEKIKGQYYLANAALYLNTRAMEKYCGSTPYRTVLFFYKVKEDCPQCRAQGGVLDSLRKTHPEMQVFAFPSDTDYEFVNVFLRRHNITGVPSLVIDDRVVLGGLSDEAAVESRLSG